MEAPSRWQAVLQDRTKFVDIGRHYLCVSPQGSPEWVKFHSLFLTTSRFRKARGLDWWAQRDLPALLEEFATGVGIPFENEAMRHGKKFEPKARDWYVRKTGLAVTECNMAVAKWDLRLGASPDGLVHDPSCKFGPFGLIEIKCPFKGMYEGLRERMENPAPESTDFSHIKPEHYEQMQGAMAIFERTWCHYIVYDTIGRQVYDEIVPFNKEFWETELYPDLCAFWRTVEEWKAPAA